MRSTRFLLASAAFLAGAAPPAEAGRIYGVSASCSEVCFSRMWRTDPSVTSVSVFHERLAGMQGIALDPLQRKIYWSEIGFVNGILRGDATGCEVVHNGFARGLEVDALGGKLYWLQQGVQRANLDGTAVEVFYAPGGNFALDTVHGNAYVVERTEAETQVTRVPLDGTAAETLWVQPDVIYGIAVDPGGGAIYWSEPYSQRLRRADLDGANRQDLLYDPDLSPDSVILEVDPSAGKIYWLGNFDFPSGQQLLKRANLDGSGAETAVALPLMVNQIAVDVSDEVGISSLSCSPEQVPGLGRFGLVALVLLLLAAPAMYLRARGPAAEH